LGDNDNDSKWLRLLMYLFMIDDHIISIGFGFNWFHIACGFNTKMHYSKRKVLINLNVQDEWYNGKNKQKKMSNWRINCWTLTLKLPNFWVLIFVMHFYMNKM
jgi:hypothetical protein